MHKEAECAMANMSLFSSFNLGLYLELNMHSEDSQRGDQRPFTALQ